MITIIVVSVKTMFRFWPQSPSSLNQPRNKGLGLQPQCIYNFIRSGQELGYRAFHCGALIQAYTLSCKWARRFSGSRTLLLTGNNLIIPGQGEFGYSDIPDKDGKIANRFFNSVPTGLQSGGPGTTAHASASTSAASRLGTCTHLQPRFCTSYWCQISHKS